MHYMTMMLIQMLAVSYGCGRELARRSLLSEFREDIPCGRKVRSHVSYV